MIQKALEIVNNLNDVHAVKMLKEIYKSVFMAIPYDEVKQNIKDDDAVSDLLGLGKETLRQNIDPKKSVALTRSVLSGFSRDETLAMFVVDAWEKIEQDDSLMIETIITLSLATNLTLLIATTELEFEYKGVKIKKGKADAKLVKAVMSPLVELIKKLPL